MSTRVKTDDGDNDPPSNIELYQNTTHTPFDETTSDDDSEVYDYEPKPGTPLYKLRPFLIKGVDDTNTKILKYYTNVDIIDDISEWELQRTINEDHWMKIYNEHVKYYKKNGCFFFIGAITCCYIKDSDKLTLVDGQHRLRAISKLAEKTRYRNKIMFALDVVLVEDDDEIHDIFCSINNILQINVESIPRRNLSAKLVTFLDKTFNAFGKGADKDAKHQRPYLTKADFVRKINNTLIIHHIKNINELTMLVTKKNAEYASKPLSFFPKLTITLYDRARKNNFYLGLVKNYEWVDEINEEYITSTRICE
jgi:hypothetical protein